MKVCHESEGVGRSFHRIRVWGLLTVFDFWLNLRDTFVCMLFLFSSLYHISGEVVKDETHHDEIPKETQLAQNGLENSEKGDYNME